MRLGEIRHQERLPAGRPLDGVRVLSVEQMQALPYATQLMAHLGADVVKVETPKTGDAGRVSQPSLEDVDGRRVGATYLRNNLSKQSLAIDLKHPDGRALFERLVPRFDVVAENLRPGAMRALGLGPEAIAKLSPRTVTVSISGFGSGGESPYASWPSYAPVAEAMSGLYEPNRKEGQPPPVVVAGALGDVGTALFAVIGTLAALRHRERTGLGQHVDLAMFDAMIAISDMPAHLWSMGAPERWAASGSLGVCAGFRARDGHFVVAVFREHQFQRLAQAVGHPEWSQDPRFATREGWALHTDSVIRPALEHWARDKSKLEASRELCAAGIVAGPSNTAADLSQDPHVALRDMLIEVPRTDAERPFLVVGNPVKLSRVAEGPVRRFPSLGQHTDATLREDLGLSEPEIAALRASGAIG
ncbi:MAG TPA: CaiB/BaiF CoA-transferase family protein [Myxococcota bacterium]|jgi:formyl-CoA transferase